MFLLLTNKPHQGLAAAAAAPAPAHHSTSAAMPAPVKRGCCPSLNVALRSGPLSRGAAAHHSTERCEQRRTRLLYSVRFCTYREAASGLAGEAQLGSVSRLWMEVRIVETLWQGDHWSWMMSRQMLPSLRQAHHQSEAHHGQHELRHSRSVELRSAP